MSIGLWVTQPHSPWWFRSSVLLFISWGGLFASVPPYLNLMLLRKATSSVAAKSIGGSMRNVHSRCSCKSVWDPGSHGSLRGLVSCRQRTWSQNWMRSFFDVLLRKMLTPWLKACLFLMSPLNWRMKTRTSCFSEASNPSTSEPLSGPYLTSLK